ncbi:MAG: insulinase family protein, partial [Treponema sp.]|nr:insulinase family protein [Treponema sp.]
VATGTLDSGMKYYIMENSLPENRALIRLVVNAGSLHEEDHEQGLAHFVEHMAFRGTTNFPEAELVNYLRSLGMRFGAHVNAFTSFDRTAYIIEVPLETDDAGRKVIPATAMSVIDDWSRGVTFNRDVFETERLVVIEEYRTRLGAMERIRQEWLPVLFRGSRFAERMPIGKLEILQNATIEDLEGFYHKWYRADNMALVFVGDFDKQALEESLGDHFGISAPQVPTPRPTFDLRPPQRNSMETLVLTDPELTSTNVLLYFKRDRQARRGDLAELRESVIDYLIQDMVNLRFNDAMADPESPFAGAGAYTDRWGFSSRFYVMSAVVKSGLAEEGLTELLRANEAIRRFGFTDSEISLAGDSLITYYTKLVQEKDRQQSGRFTDLFTQHFVDREAVSDFEWEFDAIKRLLPGITAKDINAVMRQYFAANDIQAFIFAPDSEQENLPGDADIRRLVAQRGRMTVQPPENRVLEEQLMAEVPTPGTIAARSVDADTGAVRWELGNGAKVILFPTRNRNDEIVMQAMARGGTTSASDAEAVSALLARDMSQASGLGPWSAPELTRFLATKQVSLFASITGYTRTLQGSSTAGDLETFFQALHLTFTDQRMDPPAVEALMARHRTAVALRSENPDLVFADEITRITTGDHPRFRVTGLEQLAEADMDTALAFLNRGLNPADYTFVFTGNLTPELMAPYVETYLASIPRGRTWNTWTDLGIRRPGRVESNVFMGVEEQSTVRLAWFMPMPFTEQTSIVAQALDEYLSVILNTEIREKRGGVYSIGISVSLSPTPQGELQMQIAFRCDPGRVQELSDAVLAVLDEATGTIDRTVFENGIQALHKALETQMQSNGFIAQSFANSEALLNLPLSRLQNRPQYFDAVTVADIRQMLAGILPTGPAKIVLYPAAMAGE